MFKKYYSPIPSSSGVQHVSADEQPGHEIPPRVLGRRSPSQPTSTTSSDSPVLSFTLLPFFTYYRSARCCYCVISALSVFWCDFEILQINQSINQSIMSGGVGPTGGGGIEVSKAAEDEAHLRPGAGLQAHSPRRGHRFLSFRQLNALATLVVLAASGTVPLADLAFAVLSLPYLYLLSALSFPPVLSSPPPPIFGDRNLLLSAYVALGALLGLLLPVAYILDGVLAGDKHGLAAAAPHVFLLAAQVFLEGVTFSHKFSLPLRAFVPVAYNSRRLFTLADWLRDELRKVDDAGPAPPPPRRVLAGRVLAVANLAFWSFNLLGFLIPVYLPRALRRHYSASADNNNNDNKIRAQNNNGEKEKKKA